MIALVGMWCKDTQVPNSNPDSTPDFYSHSCHQFWVWAAVTSICLVPYRLGICSGWRSPTGSPSGVKYFSNSFASSDVSDSRWLSLCPSSCSDECASIEALEENNNNKPSSKKILVVKLFCSGKKQNNKNNQNHC